MVGKKGAELSRDEIGKLLLQAEGLISRVLEPGVLDTREHKCTSCPHGPHTYRANLNDFKAKTELSGMVNKLQKWAALLSKPPETVGEEGTDDGHQ